MERCFNPPVGASAGQVTVPVLDIRFNADGSLSGEPRILKAGPSPLDRAVAEAAQRAVRRCSPYNIPAKFAPYYDAWKQWSVYFDVSSI
jgi:colicin import membrane protein